MENKYLYLTEAELINYITMLDRKCRILEKTTKIMIDYVSGHELSHAEYVENMGEIIEGYKTMREASSIISLMRAALRDKYGVFCI